MTVFISGGCKNGKSSIAEDVCQFLAENGPLCYIATMQAFDDEDRARIKRHVASRDGKGFVTLEQPVNILEVLKKSDCKNTTYLLDSVTALMINELYRVSGQAVTTDRDAPFRVVQELTELCRRVKNIVFVSDYIYMEKGLYSEYTHEYLEALSFADRALADVCDAVCEVSFGNIEMYKGVPPV